MPKPYGRGPTLYPGMGRGPRYWNADFKFASLPEAENTSDAKIGWVFEVLMPEAFTNDVLYLELDRAARLAVAAMTDAVACSDLDSFIRRDDELAWHRKILLNLTKRSSLSATSEELEVALSSFSKYVAAGSSIRSPYHNGSVFAAPGRVGPLISDILERYNERPVEVVLGNADERPFHF